MKIVTPVVNNVDFIEIQYNSLKKHFQGPYEFIVFNDAKSFPDYTNFQDATIKGKIEEKCSSLGIRCINIPNEEHRHTECAVRRCADSSNYILQFQKENPDKYLLLDSDMFLIGDFDIEKYSNYNAAVVYQSRNNNRINYIWNGIYYFDMLKMSDIELLDWKNCPGCDVGGMMHQWLNKQMKDKIMPSSEEIRWTDLKFHTKSIYFIKHLWSNTWNGNDIPKVINNDKLLRFLHEDPRNTNGKFFCEIYDDVFLHYRAGGNWLRQSRELHETLTNKLKIALI